MDQFSTSIEQHVHVSDNVVNELVSALHKSVQIADVMESENSSDGEEEPHDYGGSRITSSQKQLSRYKSFPSHRKPSSPSSSDKEDEEPEPAVHELFVEEHSPSKLVSAMKGSREKQGVPQSKLRVTWAPDVYDPTPTSVSHAVRRGTRQQRVSRKDKRHGKRGHKGKDSARGNGSKDSSGTGGNDKKKKKKKQQFAQPPASSNPCYKLLDHPGDGVLDLRADRVEEFETGILDNASCGSSFLKISLSKAHFSVAEAL